MSQQKLIMLNGFAGVGKTTLAKKYIAQHPLALSIEGDELICNIGQWLAHENEARRYVFALTKSMTDTYLSFGKTVIIPYLLINETHAESFEQLADKHHIPFYEIFLSVEKEKAIAHLFERGTMGEKDLPPITKKDEPMMHGLYDTMVNATKKRVTSITIHPIRNDIEKTYQELLKVIHE